MRFDSDGAVAVAIGRRRTFGSAQGALTGTSPVTAVAAPAASKVRFVTLLNVYNRDSAGRTITAKKVVSATPYVLDSVALAAAAGADIVSTLASASFPSVLLLTATTQSVTVEADATAATTEPCYVAQWYDEDA